MGDNLQRDDLFDDNNQPTNWDSLTSLKGIAILTVVIGHYLDLKVCRGAGLVANAFISIFFILSGYGIYQTLEGRGKQAPFKLCHFPAFLARRLVRLYPLFVIAVLMHWMVLGERHDLGAFLGLPPAPPALVCGSNPTVLHSDPLDLLRREGGATQPHALLHPHSRGPLLH